MGHRQLILRLFGRYQFHNRRIQSDVIYSAQFTVRDAESSRPTRRHRCAFSPKHGPLAVHAEPVRISRMHPRSKRVQWRHSIARSSSAHSRVCSRLRRSFSFVMTTCPRNSCWSSTRLILACGCITIGLPPIRPSCKLPSLPQVCTLSWILVALLATGQRCSNRFVLRFRITMLLAASGTALCGAGVLVHPWTGTPAHAPVALAHSPTRPLAPVGCSLNA